MSSRLRIILGVVVLALAVGFVAEWATSSPALCMSCHEIQKRGNEWKQSGHAQVECVQCHAGPHAWYSVPAALVDRTRLLAHDVAKHVSGDYEDPVDSRPEGFEPMQDEVCLNCHDVNRKATSGFRILIDHPKHAKANGSCVSCHIRTAHPLPERSRAMSFMTQCFTCHGTAKYPKASATCVTCHPTDYQLLPASHTAKNWERGGHGKVQQLDRNQCEMCHKKDFCTGCHGLEMPHPAGWAKSHAVPAQADRQVCARCHLEKPDLCSMCHHKDWEPQKGPWVTEHPLVVSQRGVDFCMGCHTRAYCSYCHVASLSVAPTATP